jgi:hypothetical protein
MHPGTSDDNFARPDSFCSGYFPILALAPAVTTTSSSAHHNLLDSEDDFALKDLCIPCGLLTPHHRTVLAVHAAVSRIQLALNKQI